MRTVRSRVIQIIEERGMTQAAVARAAGFKPKAFNDMLRDIRPIRADDIAAICRALKITPNRLYKPMDQSTKNTRHAKE